MDKGGKWTWQGGEGPTCHVVRPHHGATRCAKWPFHITDPKERLPKPSQALIQCRFALVVMMKWSWIHGSTMMDLEPSNRPWNCLTYPILSCADFTTTFGSQSRPYNRKTVKSRANRRPYHAAQRPSYLHRLTCRL